MTITPKAPRRGAAPSFRPAAGAMLALLALTAAGTASTQQRPAAPAVVPATVPSIAPAAVPTLALPAQQLPGAAAAPVPVASTAAAGGTVRELNLTQLGIDYAIQLRGISGTIGIPFNIRADELVTAASFRLNYAYSPSLIPELSHLKVTVNDVLVATLPVNRADGGKPQTADIPIDRRLITEFNRINVELIGHYTRDCEDPAHTSLWARIDASSTLRLNVSPLKLTNDLATLPQPFFDRRDVRRARIPFVFGSAESGPLLEAAGVVSSWFGALADYRGAVFPVSRGQLPSGHAVVFATPETSLPGLVLPSIQGPALGGAPPQVWVLPEKE